MVIVEDTRNQLGKHKQINADLIALGHQVVRSKLYVGDYARIDNMTICIDTKKDWVEVAGNICGKQHTRFREECIRAKDAGIKLIILVEEQKPINEWKSPLKRNGQPYCNVSNSVLEKAINTMSIKYGVEFRHCSKTDTARVITKVLEGK